MLRRELRAAAKRERRTLLIGGLFWLVGGVVMIGTLILTGTRPAVPIFMAGIWAGQLPLLWTAFVTGQGFTHRFMGADAEEWTAAELAKLDKSRWHVFHDVLLEDTNIDHVVIGPRRVYAFETKWIGYELTPQRAKSLGGSAAWRAEQLRKALGHLGVSRTVRPMVVVWGPGARDIATAGGIPVKAAKARILFGWHADDWRKEMSAAISGVLEIDAPALEAVRTLSRQRPVEQRDVRTVAGPRS